MLTQLAGICGLLVTLAAGQATGTLRVRVVLMDASGVATPVPRLVLLISDNPPTDEPRRIRTSADGTVDLKLKPGSYTVELDEAIAFRGKAYTWTETVDVVEGRDTTLDLTEGNAETVAGARLNADAATLLNAWRDSVVEIWTPTAHASGFVVDATRGLIATSHHAIRSATSVEVQLTSGKDRIKVPGRVIVSERVPGAAIVWIDPQPLQSTRAIDAGCATREWPAANDQDPLYTIGASILAPKELSDGRVTRTTAPAIFSDMRIGGDSEGGPVFAQSGALLGISAIDDRGELRRWNEAWVVPAEAVCAVIGTAVTKIADAAPPAGTRLPLESITIGSQTIKTPKPGTAPNAVVKAPPVIAVSSFDITLMTAGDVRTAMATTSGPKADFGAWSEYFRDVDGVVVVRVSPRLEERLWKTLARGAAATQGVALPPLRSFTANFLQLRAYCDTNEAVPIHPFAVEHDVPGRSPIREGLYVFDPAALGSHCRTVQFSIFSEQDPQRPETKVIDSKLFDQPTRP